MYSSASESTPLTNIASNLWTKENAAAAGTFAKGKFDELRKQASDGDVSMRMMALLAGLLLVFLAATEFLGKVLTLHFVDAILEVYTFVFGIVILILEGNGQIPLVPQTWVVTIHKYALILKYVWGRGALYVVAGTLQIAQQGLFDWLVGGFVVFVGGIYIKVGKEAQAKLVSLKSSTISTFTLKNRFYQAASSGEGKDQLNMEAFKALTLTLGLDLNRKEMEAAFLVADQDDNGLISYQEFERWWNALGEPGSFQLV